jgi:signal recognition particle GTPase
MVSNLSQIHSVLFHFITLSRKKRKDRRVRMRGPETLPTTAKPAEHRDVEMNSGWRSELSVVFVLGGPGSGKGTHCKKLAESHQMEHLSVGDVLRSEVDNQNSKYGHIIRQNMEEGRVGPMEITVELLDKAIKAAYNTKRPCAFLLDGELSKQNPNTQRSRADAVGLERVPSQDGPSPSI